MITWVSDDGFLSSYIIVSYLAILQLHGKTFLRYFHDDGQYHKIVVDFIEIKLLNSGDIYMKVPQKCLQYLAVLFLLYLFYDL